MRDNLDGQEARNLLLGANNKMKSTVLTLTGNYVLAGLTTMLYFVDPGGGARNFTLPALTTADQGTFITLVNTADAAEVITIKNSGASTVLTLTQAEVAQLYWDGAVWYGYVGVA